MTARALTEGEGGSAKCISKRSSAGDIRFDQEGLHPDTLISDAAPPFLALAKTQDDVVVGQLSGIRVEVSRYSSGGCVAVFSLCSHMIDMPTSIAVNGVLLGLSSFCH